MYECQDPGGVHAMDTVFCDSFDHLPVASAGYKYGGLTGTYSLVTGPRYGSAAAFAGGGNHLDRAPARAANGSTWGGPEVVGPAPGRAAIASVQLSLSPPAGWGAGVGAVAVLAMVEHDLGTPGAYTTRQWLEVASDGSLAVRRAGALVASSAAGVFPFRGAGDPAWRHVEYRTRLNTGAAGTLEVRVEGTLVLSVAGGQTVTTATTLNEVRLGNLVTTDGEGGAAVGTANSAEVWADDFYFAFYRAGRPSSDPDAAPPSQGPLWVCPNRPVGPGFRHTLVNAFPATAGASHWTLVAEATPDGDATYLQSLSTSTSQGSDLYAVAPWPALPGVPPAQRVCIPWWITRHPPGGSTSPMPFLPAAARYFDSDLGHYVLVYSPRSVDATYRLTQGLHDANDRTLEDMQWGMNTTTIASAWRCTHLFVELIHATPVPVPVAGRAWAVWWP